MNKETTADQQKEDGDEWLHALSGTKGKSKQHFSFDVFNLPFAKMFPDHETTNRQDKTVEKESDTNVAKLDIVMGTKFTCRVCGCEFNELREQHDHFKTPLHVINLKRNLVGLDSVSHEDEINSDEEEENIEGDDVLDPELDEMKLSEGTQDGRLSSENTSYQDGWVRRYNHKVNGSVIAFRKYTSNWEFSISSAIFDMSRSTEEAEDPWHTLKNTLQIFQYGEKLHSCVLVLQSGMFAGAIFEGNKCILHKVFRRYTVRAKAGGGQSNFDSNGRKAKSAGATLRRYGEQALKEDIQTLLLSWLPYLHSSVVLFTSIPKTMKHYIFSDELQKGFPRDDSRIKTIPFMVKKPTFEEIKLVHQKCMMIEFSLIKESDSSLSTFNGAQDDLKPLETLLEDEDVTPSSISRATIEASQDDKDISPLEAVVPEHACVLLRELLAGLRSGRVEHFSSCMTSIADAAAATVGGDDTSLSLGRCQSLWLSTPHSLENLETPLHVAAEGGYSQEVLALLQAGASPEVTDIRNRYPYFLAKDKDTRDAFRRYRGEKEDEAGDENGEGCWDWSLCGIPAGITKAMLKEKKEKEKEKKRKAKQRKQQAKQEKAEQDAEDALAREKELAAKKELEAKNYKLVGECGFCQKSLMGIVPLDVFDRRCCSSGCVVMLRRKLAADAAEKRGAAARGGTG